MKQVLKKLKMDDGLEVDEEKAQKQGKDLARGFGDKINWMTYEEGLKEAKEKEKILVLLIHKTWCGSCKALKPKFAASEELAEMSKKFVMVNVEDKEEPSGSQFVVDGEYVPRIYFLNSKGEVDESIYNEGTKHRHVKYYYESPEELIASMKRALGEEKLGSGETSGETKKQEVKDDIKAEGKKEPWWMPKKDADKADTRGFGTHVQWMKYEEGLKEANNSGKVMMLIITKSWCSSCKAFKERIASDKNLGDWGKKFVMVNVIDDEEPKDKQLQPDGQYVPRVLFLDSNGKVLDEFWNEGTDYKHVKHYYQNGDEIIASMKRVLKKFKTPVKSFGWGDKIDWVDMDEAFDIGAEQKKPVMLIIHKSWCSACKALKPKFARSKEILEQSKNFVMVTVEDDDRKTDANFDVDGAYVPRIYFVDPYTKKIMKEFRNDDEEFEDYKYAYGDPKELVKVMTKAATKGVTKGTVSGKGFGDSYLWMDLEAGLGESQKTKKPVMLVMHKSWCQHSQALKAKFNSSKDIQDLSRNFILVNLEDDEIPAGKYEVDGAYVPRIVFLDSSGEVMKDMKNADSEVEGAEFFYSNESQIVKTMKKMIPGYNLDNGFGKEIQWMTMKDGLQQAKTSGKPVMLIIHKSWCGACKALKPKIAGSKEILDLSKMFIMINIADDEEPKDDRFDVDGKYYPRVYFLDSDGEVLKSIHNTELDYVKYKFAYGDEEQVLKSMKQCLEKVKPVIPEKPGLDNGLGKEINWMTLDDGLVEARKSWRPLMLIIHKSWCSTCKVLKPRFNKSKQIKSKSRDFVMVNVADDFDARDKRFDIDGAYIPRVLFLDPMGNVMKDIWNRETIYKDNKYYYYEAASIVESMDLALDRVAVMKKPVERDEL
ncbi:uncharacterized protein LOC5519795 isoform X2 [Nematostella vectensis]|nr:uncharacterized protein LOC5519795 isoform X2 [Nematostella vectensis]